MSKANQMLWYKAWTDTRMFFFLGMFSLIAMVGALNMAYPGSPGQEFPHGALAVRLADVRSLPQDARSYIWLHWFGNTLVIWLSILAVALASTGFPPPRAATGSILHTLALPVSRRIMAGVRVAMGFVELVIAAVIPTLLVCVAAALRGQSYSVREGLVQSLLAVAGAGALYALFVFFSATLGEMAKGILGCATLFLFGLFTFLVDGVQRYSIFRLMTGDMYFLRGEIPWLGIAGSVCASLLLIAGSVAIVERRDY